MRLKAGMTTYASKIVYDITQAIVRGELFPDQVLTEAELADRFKVSRTPVRQAIAILAGEGMLRRSSGRSYTVRRFGPKEMLDAIDVRGALEGLAVREVIEHKMGGAHVVRELDNCLALEEEVLAAMETQGLDENSVYQYFAINSRFHKAIIQGAHNDALIGALEAVYKIPFVSAGSLARYKSQLQPKDHKEELRYFVYSHMQHLDIVDAIRAGQGARAEKLMTEHAQLAARHIHLHEQDPLSKGEDALAFERNPSDSDETAVRAAESSAPPAQLGSRR